VCWGTPARAPPPPFCVPCAWRQRRASRAAAELARCSPGGFGRMALDMALCVQALYAAQAEVCTLQQRVFFFTDKVGCALAVDKFQTSWPWLITAYLLIAACALLTGLLGGLWQALDWPGDMLLLRQLCQAVRVPAAAGRQPHLVGQPRHGTAPCARRGRHRGERCRCAMRFVRLLEPAVLVRLLVATLSI